MVPSKKCISFTDFMQEHFEKHSRFCKPVYSPPHILMLNNTISVCWNKFELVLTEDKGDRFLSKRECQIFPIQLLEHVLEK